MSLLDIFTEKDTNKLLFLPNIGISNNLVNSYNNFINDQAKVFFSILDKINLDYYVFAGSAIGLVRTENNIPWVDDYDIIVFEENINFFETKVIPIIKKNKFTIKPFVRSGYTGGYQIYSNKENFYTNLKGQVSKFQCDVFFTFVDKNNYIKNLCKWGLYGTKNVNINLVKPKTYKIFNGIKLPFFKDYKKDVTLEYGDVINNCVIHINHGRKLVKINQKHFSEIYKEYENIQNIAIQNTLNLIDNTTYNILNNDINNLEDNLLSDNNYLMNFNIISFIKKNNLKDIIIKKNKLLRYVYNIKHYCPDIKIIVDIPEFDFKYLFNLNYVNEFCYKSEKELIFLNSKDIIWLNKPILIPDPLLKILAKNIDTNKPEINKNKNTNINTNSATSSNIKSIDNENSYLTGLLPSPINKAIITKTYNNFFVNGNMKKIYIKPKK
jgi:hypothetical protein